MPLSRSVPATTVMIAVAVVPVILAVPVTTDVFVLVLAEARRQPSIFNSGPRPVVIMGPVVIPVIVEVVVIAHVNDIVGRPH
jgi:hypothetical protein